MLALDLDIRDKLPKYSEALTLLNKALARDMETMTKSYLSGLDDDRANKLGGARSHYYETASNNTRAYSSPGNITIAIQQIGLGVKYTGEYSKITPKASKWLTIPANAEAYGRRAREFELEFSMVGGRRPALVKKSTSRGTYRDSYGNRHKRAKLGQVMYWLKKSLKDASPDHSVIPSEQDYYNQAGITVNRVVNALNSGRRTIGGLGGE